MTPVYGLAEASVGPAVPAAGPRAAHRPHPARAVRRASTAPCRPVPTTPPRLRFVACGRPLPGHEVRIVDDDGREVGERVGGPARVPRAVGDARLLPQPGADGAPVRRRLARHRRPGLLAPTARSTSPAASRTSSSAAGATSIRRRSKRPSAPWRACARAAWPCSAAPIRQRHRAPGGAGRDPRHEARCSTSALRDAVGRAVVAAIGEPADEIVLAPPHTVLKTSSGKVRRSACRALFEQGRIGAPPSPERTQVLRLAIGALAAAAASLAPCAGRPGVRAARTAVFWLLAPPTWLLTVAMPRPAAAWAVARRAARLLLRLAGVPFTEHGLQHLPAPGPACWSATTAATSTA